jgi:hypothetical protein
MERREWHQPKLYLLDAGATAQKRSTDVDFFRYDPNNRGDLGEPSVEGPGVFSAFGRRQLTADLTGHGS